jgi:hypothetical protein
VKNLFQCDEGDPIPAYLVRYRILAWLKAFKNIPGTNGVRGYQSASRLISDAAALGLDRDLVLRELIYLLEAHCIVAEHLRTDSIAENDLITLSPAGSVHLDFAEDFYYLAACAEDLYFTEESVAREIKELMIRKPISRALGWETTLEAAHKIVRYLADWSQQISSEAESLTNQHFPGVTPDFARLLSDITAQLQKYREKTRKH